MLLHDLGPLAVDIDAQQRPIGGPRPTALLALLAVNANRRVSMDAIVDALWGESDRAARSATVESHVWRLRKVIEPGRERGTAPTTLVNDTGGYRLLLDPEDVDSSVFERLTDEGRDALSTHQADRALRRFDSALARWRGRPYTPYAEAGWAEAAVARLEELHTQTAERRIDALLELGETGRALTDVDALLRAAPLREHLHCQRMAALAGLARTEEALAAYRHARAILLDELGVEPGAELRAMHQRVLTGDPVNARSAATVDIPSAPAGVPASGAAVSGTAATRSVSAPSTSAVSLPRRPTPIVGRENDLENLSLLLSENPLVTIAGAAGCGKTRLAIELIHRLQADYPEGVHLVDLSQVDEPSLALDLVLTTIGVAVPAAGTAARALASQVRGIRALIVLDNCEHLLPAVAHVAESLVGDDADCSVLATSREPLGIAGEVVYGLRPLRLPDPDEAVGDAPAVAMFRARYRFAEPTAVLDDDDLQVVAEICRSLDGLPLAIELAASRGRAFSLPEIAEQVARDPGRLSLPATSAPDAGRSLRTEIDRSYQTLSEDEKTLHRALAVFPGPFTASAVTAVAEPLGLAPATAVDLIPFLVNRSLLSATRPTSLGGVTSFRQLTTVRSHAIVVLERSGAADTAFEHRDAWARSIPGRGFRLGRDEVETYRVVDDNYATVRAALERGLVDGLGQDAARYTAQLSMYWYTRERAVEARRWLEMAARRTADLLPSDRAMVLAGLAFFLVFQGRADLARPHTEPLAGLVEEIPPTELGFVGDLVTVTAASAMTTDEHDYMRELFALSRRAVSRLDDDPLRTLHGAVGSLVALAEGVDPAQCLTEAAAIHTHAAETGHRFAEFLSASAAAHALSAMDDPDEGLVWSDKALEASVAYGSRHGASAVETRANLLALCGRHLEAATVYGAARAQARRLGGRWPRRAATSRLLQETRGRLGSDDFDAAWLAGEHLTLAALTSAVPV